MFFAKKELVSMDIKRSESLPKRKDSVDIEDIPIQEISQTQDDKIEKKTSERCAPNRSSKTIDHIFDMIFHTPPNDYLALKIYGRIVPGSTHLESLQHGDSKWMIHPYSYFR